MEPWKRHKSEITILQFWFVHKNYLRFKGVEATLELASSPNSKVIVIGGGKDGLPIILDGTSKEDDTSGGKAITPKGKQKNPIYELDRKLQEAKKGLSP